MIPLVHLDDERRAPGTVRLLTFPDRFAGALVDREEIVPSLGIVRPAPEDGKVAIQDRRSAAAERVLPFAQIGAFPQLLAGVIETVHARRGEADDDTFGVKRGRTIASPGRAVGLLLVGVFDVFLPDQFAVGARQTEQAAFPPASGRLGNEDPVTPDDGGRVSLLRQWDLPPDVVLVAPLEGKVLLLAETLTRGAAPGRPVGGLNAGNHGGDDHER